MISVIIPYYNAGGWIGATLDSCIAQKEFLREIIVVNDFSADAGWATVTGYAARFPGLIRAVQNRTKGGNNARNYGYDLSGGDYIQWLDADDQVLPGKFGAQLTAFREHPDADIVYSDWRLDTYDTAGNRVRSENKQQRPYEDFLLQLLRDNWSPPHNYLMRRTIAEKMRALPAWNPATPVYQDREYFTRVAIHGARFQYCPGLYCIYNRWNRQSVSQKKDERDSTLLQLLSAFLEEIDHNASLDAAKKKAYRKAIQTTRILTVLSGKKLRLREKGISFHPIDWSMIEGPRTRIKVFTAMILHLFSK